MTRKKRDPGITPIENLTLTYAETGEPVPRSEPPSRRRRAPLAADPTPPYADLQELADQVLGAIARDEVDRTAAGLRVSELRAERTRLDAEMRQVRQAVRAWKRAFPDSLVPTRTVAAFDRTRDAIAENEREMALLRFALAPGVDLEHATLAREAEQRAKQVRADARQAKAAADLEAALETGRVEGRKEYAAVAPVIERLFAPPTSGRVVDSMTASAHRSEMAAARARVSHPLHATSQYTTFRGDPVMIFTGR